MEFNEKLQHLRKQNNLTQEQLAKQLYVSRTAVSKWESGKGYPNIESLKCISQLFTVTIDELLSGEELISLAESENHFNMEKVYKLIYGMLDLLVIGFIFLPLYGQWDGSFIRAVNLLEFTDTIRTNLIIYWVIFSFVIGLGMAELIFTHFEKELWCILAQKCSIILEAVAICIFAAAREPYVTALLFLLFVIKIFVLVKQDKPNKKTL